MTELRQRWILDPAATDDVAAMYVEQRIPDRVTASHPIVLLHGGGGQGTDWGTTPDGRPGWADLLVDRGWPVHVVDRPGHGRSPGRLPAPAAIPMTARVFAPGDRPDHSQWPGTGGVDDPAVRLLAASASGLPVDLAVAQVIEQRLLEALLDEVGPAVIVAHSLGACAAWLVAEARPDLVAAVVALEPAGPPFLDVPGTPLRLPEGITAAPLGSGARLTGLPTVPVSVVEGETSRMAEACGPVVEHLREAGVDVEHIVLVEHGLRGNGHGLPIERNNRDVLEVILNWITTLAVVAPTPARHSRTGEQP